MNNLPRQKLCEILKIYGKDACNDYKHIRGLLNDFCSGDYPEIKILLAALEEQVHTELAKSSRTIPYEMLSAQLVNRLCTQRLLTEEAAHWTVDSWAQALGVISRETPYIGPHISLNAPKADQVNVAKSYARTTSQQPIIVSPTGGHYTSIGAALNSAAPNTVILVKPGYYHEGFTIDKQVEIRGDGSRDQIIIESRNTSCIEMQTNDEVLVRGLTLRCRANPQKHAVDIPMGHLKLIECNVTCDAWACIGISGRGTYAEIRSSCLHGANRSGLLIEDQAQGIIENCKIYNNRYPNIAIKPYTKLVIKKCKIYDGQSHGIQIWEYSIGIIEDCDIFGNGYEWLSVKNGGKSYVRECREYNNFRRKKQMYQYGMENTRFPNSTTAGGTSQQREYPNIRSEELYTNEMYSTGNATHQKDLTYQSEKKQSLLDRFLHSISLKREK